MYISTTPPTHTPKKKVASWASIKMNKDLYLGQALYLWNAIMKIKFELKKKSSKINEKLFMQCIMIKILVWKHMSQENK